MGQSTVVSEARCAGELSRADFTGFRHVQEWESLQLDEGYDHVMSFATRGLDSLCRSDGDAYSA